MYASINTKYQRRESNERINSEASIFIYLKGAYASTGLFQDMQILYNKHKSDLGILTVCILGCL